MVHVSSHVPFLGIQADPALPLTTGGHQPVPAVRPGIPIALIARRTSRGTHKGHQCQEGVRTWPGDYARRRAGLNVLLDPSSQLPGRSSRARKGWLRLDCQGSCAGSRCVAGGVVSQAPIRRRASVRGGCHDHVSGNRAAQSDDRARRGRRLMPQERACPGLGDPPVFTAAAAARSCWWLACRPAGARRGSAACGRSRWWRSSSRAAWRWPRRWRRTPGPLGGLRRLVQHPPQPGRALLSLDPPTPFPAYRCFSRSAP